MSNRFLDSYNLHVHRYLRILPSIYISRAVISPNYNGNLRVSKVALDDKQ